MNLTENFSIEEFCCHDSAHTPYPSEWVEERLRPLCNALEIIRHASGGPLHILSGYRTKAYNEHIYAAMHKPVTHSQHTEGRAADIASRTLSPLKLHNLIEALIIDKKIPEGGLGQYDSFCHYDVRGTRARWRG